MTVGRTPVDVLLVSLGTTFGLRAADDQLAEFLRDGCALTVQVARAAEPRAVRTLALTDLVQARACAAAARAALAQVEPRTVIYASTTAALCWPRPGAIRFDALAQRSRPGRHGLWQRPLERRRLRQATMLLPWARASLDGAPPTTAPTHVLPVAIESTGLDAEADAAAAVLLSDLTASGRRPVAITYAADPVKKGIDRIAAAWQGARQGAEVVLVAGHDRLPPELAHAPGIVDVGRLPRPVFRALVRAVGVFVTAPRREDYGLVQLEALAEGARLVTTTAPGPYAALPLIRGRWPAQVVDDADDPRALGRALRAAIDAPTGADERRRAIEAVAPWSRAAVLARLQDEIVPALLGDAARPSPSDATREGA